MARFSTSNVNPDLTKERQTRTFDPEILTRILDGGEWITEKRRELGEYICTCIYLGSLFMQSRSIPVA